MIKRVNYVKFIVYVSIKVTPLFCFLATLITNILNSHVHSLFVSCQATSPFWLIITFGTIPFQRNSQDSFAGIFFAHIYWIFSICSEQGVILFLLQICFSDVQKCMVKATESSGHGMKKIITFKGNVIFFFPNINLNITNSFILC